MSALARPGLYHVRAVHEGEKTDAVELLSLSVAYLVWGLDLLTQPCGSSLQFLYAVTDSFELLLTPCRRLAMMSLFLATSTPNYEKTRYGNTHGAMVSAKST
jgi:hypothetical protein